jgi:hypothetical protein
MSITITGHDLKATYQLYNLDKLTRRRRKYRPFRL